jgi:hypothetical protein
MRLKSAIKGPFKLTFAGEGCGGSDSTTPLGNPIMILRSRHSSGIMPTYLAYLAKAIPDIKLLGITVFIPRTKTNIADKKGCNLVIFMIEMNSPYVRDQDGFLSSCLRKIFEKWEEEGCQKTHFNPSYQ